MRTLARYMRRRNGGRKSRGDGNGDGGPDEYARDRALLVEEIAREARQTESYTGRAAFSEAVMAAIAAVPREAFVPEESRRMAYVNRPLPIGHGQTISQPFIVALMTDLLDLTADSRVLEIGTGCGYQTAVLAEIAAEVRSVEVVPALHETARARLVALGYDNVRLRLGDGWQGWAEHAPYDAITVTAAAAELPPALVDQLAVGGRLVIPIGRPHDSQVLKRLVKGADGSLTESARLPVAFVPLVKR